MDKEDRNLHPAQSRLRPEAAALASGLGQVPEHNIVLYGCAKLELSALFTRVAVARDGRELTSLSFQP